MTPKEKAEELVIKMLKGLYDTDLAVPCALIAVDEILDLYLEESRNTRYWEDVKEEIENLKTK
jgi:hypothetical protein